MVAFEEIFALLALYTSTLGENWKWQNEQVAGPKWNFTREANGNFMYDPCKSAAPVSQTWQGITCSKPPNQCNIGPCQINKIELSRYNLFGTLPFELSNLTSLVSLYLSSNKLTGPIPPQIGHLTKLRASPSTAIS